MNCPTEPGLMGNIRGTVLTLSVPGDSTSALYWVLPTLAQNSHADRWTIWIAPPLLPHSAQLSELGFNLSHTRLVHPRDNQINDNSLIEQALRAHTNAIVLAWPQTLSDRELEKLQTAAVLGNTCGLLFMDSSKQIDSSKAINTSCAPAHSIGPEQLDFHTFS